MPDCRLLRFNVITKKYLKRKCQKKQKKPRIRGKYKVKKEAKNDYLDRDKKHT